MGRKVFVSYKFSDAVSTRERLISALGNDGHYYKGEKGFEKLEVADQTIKNYLADMIYDSSVTIVVISPSAIFSDWIEWEIRYSLEKHNRNGRVSGRNGVVCLVRNDPYFKNVDWAKASYLSNKIGKYNAMYFPDIIKNNVCGMRLLSSMGLDYEDNFDVKEDFFVIVSENTFFKNPSKYIEEAHRRSQDPKIKLKTR